MAPPSLIRLDWFRCRDGYRIENRTDSPSQKGRRASLLLSTAGRYIVRNSATLDPTTPLRIDGLYRVLAEVEDDDSALDFVKSHGFLDVADAEDQRIKDVLRAAAGMRDLINVIDKKRWRELTDHLASVGRDSGFGSGGVGRLGAVFDWREGMERPDLYYRPGSLLSAISLQALQDAAGGAELRKCDRPGCPKYFEVGPGTGRPRLNRGIAYCTPKCQKAHAYLQKKGGSK